MTGTPILVGAGQFCERVDEPGYEGLSPVAIAARAGSRALADADADAGGRLGATIDIVASTRTFADMGAAPAPFGTSDNFPRSIAARLGLDPRHAYWDGGGGNSPQRLVNLMFERLATSQSRAVLIAGGEATATLRHLQRTGGQASWAETVGGSVCDQGSSVEGIMTEELVTHGLSNVPAAYALLENARRRHLGTGRDEYARAMAEMFAPFTDVAAVNPYSAAATTAMSASELLAEGPRNRVIASPYPLSLVARDQGNQGAALVLTTAEHAHRVGVPEENWVYLHGHADLTERPMMDRPQLGAYPAAVAASRSALRDAGLDVADIDVFDFYSCFPIAVSAVAVDGLGLAPDDPRGLTVSGGMPYFGGPGNNYSLHAIADMAHRLRTQPGSFGLLGANGGFLSKYSAGVYSTLPAIWTAADHRAVQDDLDGAPAVARELRPDGPGVVETFTVIHTRGQPSAGVVIGRLIDNDARFIATTADGDDETLGELLSERTEVLLGRRVHVTTDGGTNRFTV